mgnify:CR=1 FL=1
MAKNYYITLGISRGADLNQIKKAYRTIAKQSHPDTTRSRDSEDFREAREAYEILSNDRQREKYDAELAAAHPPPRPFPDLRKRRRKASLFDEMHHFESFVDDFFEGFVPGIHQKARYRSSQKDLYYEVILSSNEAVEGGLFPISVPVIEACPRCGQSGIRNEFHCPQCSGYGHIRSEREFSLSIPPGTRHNTEVSLSLEDIGLQNVALFLTIRIDPSLD